MRIGRAIGNALAGDCEVYSSDTMLYVEAARLATYADASLVCGALETKTVTKNGSEMGGRGETVTIHGRTIAVDAVFG